MNRKRIVGGSTAIVTVVALIAVPSVWIVGTNGNVKRPSVAQRRVGATAEVEAVRQPAVVAPKIAAPAVRGNHSDGVAEAARQFAREFVTPELKFPESASFPEDAVRLEPFWILNNSTGQRVEHWRVDGAVDAKNDYGVTIRSPWRCQVGLADGQFFAVTVSLQGLPVYQMLGHVQMLQDARKAEVEAQAAREKAKKDKELAANRAIWQAIAAAKPVEQKAREALKLAVDLLEAGQHQPAHRRLRELIEKYPGTSAADEAEQLLKE